MRYLHCPMCGLDVPMVAAAPQPTVEDCPRCLARSSGAVSVSLAAGRARRSTTIKRRAATLLRELPPGARLR
jgi:hypothetical protein